MIVVILSFFRNLMVVAPQETVMTTWGNLYNIYIYIGVSLNGGTPISHPKMIILSRKTHGCWVPPF